VRLIRLIFLSGPIVRIGPNDVDVADPIGAQQIHRIKGEYLKAPWYDNITPTQKNVFNSRDVDTHRRHRKLLSGPMSESGLKGFWPQIELTFRLAIQRIDEEMEIRGCADVCKWFMFMATDIIGELSFAESFRMLQFGKVGRPLTPH
jgi:cytochrome P450